jgi:hypothetical protein
MMLVLATARDFMSPAFLAGCLVWIPIMIWIVALIGWMIQGDIDPIAGIAGVALGFALGAATIITPDTRLAPLFLIGAWSAVILFPFVRSGLAKRELAKLDVEAMESAYELLREKPENRGAMLKLAKTLQAKGMYPHAVAIADEALAGMPRESFFEEHRMVNIWRGHVRPGSDQPITCLQCGTSNPVANIYCSKCGAPYLLHYARGNWVSGSFVRKIVGAWIAAVIAIVGIPMAASSLPRAASGVVVTMMLAAVVAIAWFSFKPEGARPA